MSRSARGQRVYAQAAFFVHEERTLTEQRALRDELDRLTGRTVDVACSCGLGRRDRAAAMATVERAAELCR